MRFFLFQITAAVLSVAFAAPDSYVIPRESTHPIGNGQTIVARDRGTAENFERNRFSNQFDLQQRNPLRSSVKSNEDFSQEDDFLSSDNERNLNKNGFNRQGDGSVFGENQKQTNVGFQRDQIGFDTAENNSGEDDFFTGEGQINQQVRSQQTIGNKNEKVAGRLASGPRDHTVSVFDRGQFGNPSNEARIPSVFKHEDQANASPVSEQREVLHAFRGDRRGLHSVAPGQQTGEYLNNRQTQVELESGVNLNRQSFRQRDSRDFRTSHGQTSSKSENQLNFRGNINYRPETTGTRFDNQGIRPVQGQAGGAQNFRDTGNPCGKDEVVDFSGECVRQKITRNIFVYQKPETQEDITNEVREQTLSYNILFIKTSNEGSVAEKNKEEEKTIVYVLNKEPTEEEREELEKDKHEVYFVNYKDGENPLLPHGSRLQTELNLSENGGSANRFQKFSGNANQTQLDSFSQNFDAPGRRPDSLQDVSKIRFLEERPGFGSKNQAIFFQNDQLQNNGVQRNDQAQDKLNNFSSSSFTNQKERAPAFGNNVRGQNLSQTEFDRPGNPNTTQGNNDFALQQDFENIGNGYEAPRA